MSGINVGHVEVDIVPSAQNFGRDLGRQINPQARRVGEDIGRLIGAPITDQIARAVREGLRGAGDPGGAGAGAGEAYGGAFARTVRARIDQALRDLPNPEIDVNSSEADRKIAELRRQLEELRNARVGVDIDAATATARLDEIRGKLDELGKSSPDVAVRTDTAAARAELDRVRGDLDELNGKVADVTVRTHHEDVGGGGSGGGGGGFGMASLATSLAPLAIPVGGAALGLGAGVAALAGGAVGGLAVTKIGLDGVTAAATAMQTAQQGAGQAAVQAANQQASAAAAVSSAQAGVASAIRSADNSAISSAQAVASARRAVSDAILSTGLANHTAIEQQQAAEQALTTAQYAGTQAQLALTQARIAAKQNMEDLTNSVADGALAQRAATLAVVQAKWNLTNTLANPTATKMQRDQAQLAYDQAVQQVTDLGVRQTRLVAQQALASKQGVDGNLQVVAAQHGVVTSTAAVQNAQQKLQDANAAVTNAQRLGLEQVAAARQAEANAVRAQQFQAAQSSAAIASAQQALGNAQRQQVIANQQINASALAAKQAMANLTPAGRDFAQFIVSTIDPALKKIKGAAQEGLLPGLETGIKAAMPILPLVINLVRAFATAMGNLFAQAGQALNSPFWKQFFTYLSTQAGPIISNIGRLFGDFFKIGAALFQAFGPLIGQITGMLVGLADSVAKFAEGASKNKGFQAFLAYIMKTAPVVFHAIGQIGVVIGHLIEALAPLGAVLLVIIDKVATFLAQLSPTQLLGLLGAVAAAVAGVVLSMEEAAAPVLAIVLAVTALSGLLVIAYQRSKTFRDIVQDLGHWIGTVLYPVLKQIAEDAFAGFKKAIDIVNGAVQSHRKELTQLWNAFKDVIGFIVKSVLPIIGTLLRQAFINIGYVIDAFITVLSALVDAFNWVVRTAKTVWQDVSSFFSHLGADGKRIFTTLADDVVGAFGSIKQGLSNVWGDVERIFSNGVNFVTQKILNPLIGILNDVLGVFGVNIGKIPAIHLGGGGTTGGSGSSGGGGSRSGRQGTAFALGGVLPGYSPGVDNIAIPHSMFSGGEGILVPEATRALGGAAGIQAINSRYSTRVSPPGQFAGGGSIPLTPRQQRALQDPGSLIGGIGFEGIGSAINKIKDAIRRGAADAAIAALKVAEAPVKGILGLAPGPIGKTISHGVFNKLNSEVYDFIRGHVKKTTATGGGGGPIPTGQHLALIDQALTLAGVATNGVNEAAVNTIVNFESAWNPNAINLTDSNAQAGHPSQGLMQTIPGTFEAYRLPSLPDVITDPIANLVAGIRYAVSRYGSLSGVPGIQAVNSGGAYVGYDSGGYLPPGVTTVFNGTGKPEPVLTPQQLSAVASGKLSHSAVPRGPLMNVENMHVNDGVDIEGQLRMAEFRERVGHFG